MEYFIENEQISDFIILPKTFDWDLIDQQLGFGKVFEFIPKQLYLKLKESTNQKQQILFKLLTKAGVYYSFIFSIPRLKVHISNYGVQEFSQDKVKPSPWWDIRDLGLSMLKIADKCISDALNILGQDNELKNYVPVLSRDCLIRYPEELNHIYSINNSPDVFFRLQKFIQKAILLKIPEKINEVCFDILQKDKSILEYIKEMLVFYALYYASKIPSFVFIQNAVVFQYEELPWQKSVVLSPQDKITTGTSFEKAGDDAMKIIINYMKLNPDKYPCYSPTITERKAIIKNSGLYF